MSYGTKNVIVTDPCHGMEFYFILRLEAMTFFASCNIFGISAGIFRIVRLQEIPFIFNTEESKNEEYNRKPH